MGQPTADRKYLEKKIIPELPWKFWCNAPLPPSFLPSPPVLFFEANNNSNTTTTLWSWAKLLELLFFFFEQRNCRKCNVFRGDTLSLVCGLLFFLGLSMVANSARAQVAYTSFATFNHVQLPAPTSVLSSAPNTTASLSAGGSTNGNPTQKWEVRSGCFFACMID